MEVFGKNVMRCTIWYHLYNFKKVKDTHGGVLLEAEACNFTKSNTPPLFFFSRFLNCTNGTKSRDAFTSKNCSQFLRKSYITDV